jgi:choline-glycine betaine transporter
VKKLDIVFWFSAIVVALLVIIGAVAPKAFASVATEIFNFTTYAFGWFYLLAVLFFVLFCIVIALTKYGRVRLGNDEDRPEFPFFTWVGMLFSAGFGVGLVFWGIAEPMSHFFTPPRETVDALGEEAARGHAVFLFSLGC